MKRRLIASMLGLVLAATLVTYPAATVAADDPIRTPTIGPDDGEYFIGLPDYNAKKLPASADPTIAAYLFTVKIVGPASGGSGEATQSWACEGNVVAYGPYHNRLWSWTTGASVDDHGGYMELTGQWGRPEITHPYWRYDHDVYAHSTEKASQIDSTGIGYFEGCINSSCGKKYARITLHLTTGGECTADGEFGNW